MEIFWDFLVRQLFWLHSPKLGWFFQSSGHPDVVMLNVVLLNVVALRIETPTAKKV
jgi:hypothetical protein